MEDVVQTSMSTKVEDFLVLIPSTQSQKNYRIAIRKFEVWFGRPITSLLNEQSTTLSRVLERYYVELKKKHKQNTCRFYVNGVTQYFKFHGKDIQFRRGLGVNNAEVTTRDHPLTIGELQEMADLANLKEKIILEVLLLGLRVGDACRLEWSWFDVLNKEDAVEIVIRTRKEGVNAHTFVSEEFREYLSKYLPTLDKNNLYLLQSARIEHMSEDSLNWTLQELAKRANIKPRGQLHWHCGRKLVMRTATSLGINQWSANMLVGKAVEKDISTYIQGVSLTKDFLKLNQVFHLKKTGNGSHEIVNLEKEVDILKMNEQELREELQKTLKRLDRAEALLQSVGVNPDLVKRIVTQALQDHQPVGFALESREKLEEISEVLKIIVRGDLKKMQRSGKNNEKSTKVLEDFVREEKNG